MEREPLLQERQKTHGDFASNAAFGQALRQMYRAGARNGGTLYCGAFDKMSLTHREALDMIACKISRILSGQADFKDHWDDIAGYAKLGSEACQNQ